MHPDSSKVMSPTQLPPELAPVAPRLEPEPPASLMADWLKTPEYHHLKQQQERLALLLKFYGESNERVGDELLLKFYDDDPAIVRVLPEVLQERLIQAYTLRGVLRFRAKQARAV